ncbi:hypothetical protein BJ508DRAFT_410633 [Ascobolus immersus RN42]|uniref:Uncharacterized protein n=1 Tax=Ascobolus immersus RN42 TaxID=1160509 RepID=A0A3N4IMY1_ASCIM|nr:hypothetical protein BJ508DRAFT_410633 [Ascobolus immersus RN42]
MDDDFDGAEVIVGQEVKTTASATKDKKQQQPKKIEVMSKKEGKAAFEARIAAKKNQKQQPNGKKAPKKPEGKKDDKQAEKKDVKKDDEKVEKKDDKKDDEKDAKADTEANAKAAEEASKRKRKREADKARKRMKVDGGEEKKKESIPGKQPTTPKQKQKKQKEKRAPLQEDPVNENIAQMNPTLLSDYFGQQIRKFDKDLSSVELEERYIPARYIYDTEKLPKDRSLKGLPDFLKALYTETSQPKNMKTPGHPHTIVITGAAIRAVEFRRGLLQMIPDKQHSACTKLFSKHIKLQDALEQLGKYQSNYAIGTPKRIHDCMINDGPLKMDNLKWIIIDLSRLDAKGFNALEYPDILKDTVNILKEPKIREQFEKEHGAAKIVIY